VWSSVTDGWRTEITTQLTVPEADTVDLPDFLAWNECIRTMHYMKINAMVLEGYTNAGKSHIVDKLIGICRPE